MSFIKMKNMFKVYGNRMLAIDDFSLEIEKNEFVALIGPSGCGKSTLLRMIAGLEDITAGDLLIDGKRKNDVHSKDRDMSMVFQNYALYPHLSIYDNIAFGLKLRKFKSNVIKKRVENVSAILGLDDYLDALPSELSGGQRQRVALGRSMVQESDIFLMDEPLSNLDAKLRSKMRVEILKLHKQMGVTTIYVTHDQVEAMTMADKIVVLKDGVIQQIGKPWDLYNHPANLFVANFVGEPEINLLEGHLRSDQLFIGEKQIAVPESMKGRLQNYEKETILVGIRPEHFRTENVYLEMNPEQVISATIDIIEMRGDSSIILTKFGENEIFIKTQSSLNHHVGDAIEVQINTSKVLFFDPETGERILP